MFAGQIILGAWGIVVAAILVRETTKGFASPLLFVYPAALIALAFLATRWPSWVGILVLAFHIVAGVAWIITGDYGPVVAVLLLPAPLTAGILLLASRPRPFPRG